MVDLQTIIASNTSAIPITRLQQGRTHPSRFVGMHWCQPAHVTRFMEVIRGELTSGRGISGDGGTGATDREGTFALSQVDVPGVHVNRIGYAMYREALHLIDSGGGRCRDDRSLGRMRWGSGRRSAGAAAGSTSAAARNSTPARWNRGAPDSEQDRRSLPHRARWPKPMRGDSRMGRFSSTTLPTMPRSGKNATASTPGKCRGGSTSRFPGR